MSLTFMEMFLELFSFLLATFPLDTPLILLWKLELATKPSNFLYSGHY